MRIEAALQAMMDDRARERTRVLSGLLQTAARLVAGTSAQAVMQDACDGLAQSSPHVRLAWIWVGRRDAVQIRPMASAGVARAFAETLVVDKARETLLAPAYRALFTDLEGGRGIALPALVPSRDLQQRYGFRDLAVLPMQLGHEREAGVLTLYADEAEYFSRIGLEPFRTLARVCEGALVQVRTREALHRKATIDGLTGLINRGAMRVLLARGHALAIRYGRPLSVIMFDLDNLKTLNDVYGHEVGDFMLQGVARAARASMRESDVVSRWGGDEFLCLMPEIDGVAARRVAERLREDVAQVSVRAGAGVVRASISVGMASYPADGSGMHDLLRMADRALYRAKAQGRNTVRMASDAA